MKRLPNIVHDRRSKSGFKKVLTMLLPGISVLIFILLWEFGVRIADIDKWILPKPSNVLLSLMQQRTLILEHSLQTIAESMLGLCVAIVLGVLVATMIDLSDLLRKAFYPLLVITQTIPIIAIAPLFIIWFGYGMLPKVVVVLLVCFFPIAINLADGYRQVDEQKVRLLKAMGANSYQIFRMVKIPSALPFFFSGLRIAGTYSVMGAVIGEWLGANRGLGILLIRSSKSFLTEQVFATIVIIVILSLLIYLLVELMARIIMPWNHPTNHK